MLLDRRYLLDSKGQPASEGWDGTDTGPLGTRPVWEIEAATLTVSLGVLLETAELRRLLQVSPTDRLEGVRDEVLLRRAAEICARPGPLAETLGRHLDRAAAGLGPGPTGPLALLVGRCQLARDGRAGLRLAALLWGLARDPRWEVRGLEQRVGGDLLLRALRLLSAPPRDRHEDL